VRQWPRFGFSESVGPVRFVAEQEQPFGVAVQAADGIHLRWQAEVGEGAVVLALTRELRQDVVGLVQGDEHQEKLRVES